VGKHNVNVEKFRQAFRSFGVNANVGQAEQKAVDYRIPGVPALTIAGKYMVEGGDHAKMLSASDQLIAMERTAGRKSTK
jgi:thiol:disulfide interchange protein DsbA